ncbi:MAG: DUF4440 domain-containing protein [Thermoanaerobaculia bacterium]
MRSIIKTFLLALLALLLLSAIARADEPAASTDTALAATLRRQTQELMDAIAPGQPEPWKKYVADEALFLDENGEIADKAKMLADLTPLPAGLLGTIAVDRFRMVTTDDRPGIAIVAGEIQEQLDYHGQRLHTRFRFMDTWVKRGDRWLLLARHTGAVLKDPPAIALSPAELCEYAGTYRLTADIVAVLRCTGGGLSAERTGRPAVTYEAEVKDLFFAPGQPRSRRVFFRDATGAVTGFGDRREGEDIRWTKISDAPPPKP